ncbi:MAG TPA: hypothetical protein VGF40_11245 [Thermoanaerobaculia bacterium]
MNANCMTDRAACFVIGLRFPGEKAGPGRGSDRAAPRGVTALAA